jgi:phage terminase large subunit-like protein
MPKNQHKSADPPPFALGEPERPKSLPAAQRRAWNRLCAELLAARKLALSDGPLILEWLDAKAAQYRGTGRAKAAGAARAAEIAAQFEARPPFPETVSTPENDSQEPSAVSLEGFLANVRIERGTFRARLVPDQTVCRDLSTPYVWPEGDAAEVARRYCEQVTKGEITACDLLRRACQRHLDDLQTGHTRGLFYDPVAARNIVQWYADFCALRLEPWEVWIVTSLFGWKKALGQRRFTDAWVSMGRKNGKTTLASGIGLYTLVADMEPLAEVYSAATKKDQARLIFRDAVRAVRANPELKAALKEFRGTNVAALLVEETDSRFEPLSSDTRSMDGTRPSCILADEVHEWESRVAWDKLTKGTIARGQPLTFAITTAGESEACFAFNKHSLATKILTGVFNDDSTFVGVYQLDPDDDFRNEACWKKSNPNLDISVKSEALRKILAEALEDPSGQISFQRYIGNRWVSFRQGRSIPSAKFDACGVPNVSAFELRQRFLEEHAGEPCWLGLDLGQTNDWSCLSVLYWDGNSGVVTAVPFFWVPEYSLPERERQLGVPISEWARAGFVKLIEGDMADPRVIKSDILKLIANGHVNKLGYDPWQARTMCAEIAEESHIEVVAVKQNYSELTIPCRAFKEAIWSKKLAHLNNPVARWMCGNVILEPEGDSGGIRPRKLAPNEKIDFVQATCTAWHGMLAAPTTLDALSEGLNKRYNERGIDFF